VAKKEDIMLFGNGRYVGTYISSTTTLAPTKLDFGADTEVADVCFHANQWWIAVWEVEGTPDAYMRSGGAGVAIKVRVATLAYATIAGDLINKYDVTKRWLFRGAKGKIHMRFGYRNTGNTRVSLISTARVYTMFGFFGGSRSDFYTSAILSDT